MSKKTDPQDIQGEATVEANGKPSDAPTVESSPEAQWEEKLAQERERYLRLAAEFENYKKRVAREMELMSDAAVDRVIIQTLDVMDNFERSLSATEKLSQENEIDQRKLFESLHQGAKLIHQQLSRILAAHGVKEEPALGRPFDPSKHEAVLQLDSPDHPADHVAQVLSKGYTRGGRLIRHARVGVVKPTNSEEDS